MTRFAIYGTFMRGQPGHANLRRGTFLEAVRTAPRYRLFFVDDLWPALIPVGEGAAIACELYELNEEHLTRLAELEPPEWRRSPLELVDGRRVEAFLGDASLRQRGVDISDYGNWDAFTSRGR